MASCSQSVSARWFNEALAPLGAWGRAHVIDAAEPVDAHRR
ncbi:hypothetical protein [Nocardiopsis dassonvillei]